MELAISFQFSFVLGSSNIKNNALKIYIEKVDALFLKISDKFKEQ